MKRRLLNAAGWGLLIGFHLGAFVMWEGSYRAEAARARDPNPGPS